MQGINNLNVNDSILVLIYQRIWKFISLPIFLERYSAMCNLEDKSLMPMYYDLEQIFDFYQKSSEYISSTMVDAALLECVESLRAGVI